MAAFNKSVLVGNLTKDPTCQEVGEKKTSKCSFRLAVNNPRSKDEVLYMNIAVWGKSAESCQKYLQKGSSVLVEGRIRQTKLENESYWTEVVVQSCSVLSSSVASSSVVPDTDPHNTRPLPHTWACLHGRAGEHVPTRARKSENGAASAGNSKMAPQAPRN